MSGPLENVQLSAIIMYFYWNTDQDIHSYGNDYISKRILGWNDGTKGYHTSLYIAVGTVFVWAVLISLPLAVGATDKKGSKMMQIKNSPMRKWNYLRFRYVLYSK